MRDEKGRLCNAIMKVVGVPRGKGEVVGNGFSIKELRVLLMWVTTMALGVEKLRTRVQAFEARAQNLRGIMASIAALEEKEAGEAKNAESKKTFDQLCTELGEISRAVS